MIHGSSNIHCTHYAAGWLLPPAPALDILNFGTRNAFVASAAAWSETFGIVVTIILAEEMVVVLEVVVFGLRVSPVISGVDACVDAVVEANVIAAVRTKCHPR